MKIAHMEGRTGLQSLTREDIDRRNSNIGKAQKLLWSDPTYKSRMVKLFVDSQCNTPSNLEKEFTIFLGEFFPNKWLYNGDGREGVFIGGRLPDFVRSDRGKYVIELFGSYYHHSLVPEDRGSEEETILHYEKCGFKCLVIWGDTVFDRSLAEKISLIVGDVLG